MPMNESGEPPTALPGCESEDKPNASTPRKFLASDIVRHLPSDEQWILAADQDGKHVMPCGWPETMAEAKDCVLVAEASEESRLAMLKTWARHWAENDPRIRAARRQLDAATGGGQ